jgi:iron complex outermembrane recepter protein
MSNARWTVVASILMVFCAPLMAQSTAQTSAVAQAGAVEGDQLQEVTVTAERVAENELKTPIAITALSNAQLTEANVTSTTDLKGLVPSLNIVNQSGGGAGAFGENQMSIYIRGVGSSSRFFNNDIGIGVYIDDVYIPTTQNLNLDFYDLSDIQILKGPQGTLFGRNSFGGAVLLTTAPPSQQFGGFAQASIGSFSRLDTQGALNMPFSDVLTSRFSFFSSDVDGYITHLLDSGTNDDIHEKSARYQVHFEPSSAFSADLMLSDAESHDNGNEEITVGCNPQAHYVKDYAIAHPTSEPYCTQFKPLGQPYEVYGNSVSDLPTPLYAYNADGSILGPSGLSRNGALSSGGRQPYDEGQLGTVSLRMTWTISDELSIKSITGLRKSDLASYRDDGTPVGLYTEQDIYWDRNYTEELQALAKLWGGRLNLVAGLYYYHDNASSIQDTGPDYDDPVGYYYGNIVVEKSFAAYLQATIAVTNKFSITLGGRENHDEKSSSSQVWEGCYGSYAQEYASQQTNATGGVGGCWIPGPADGDYASAAATWKHFDPRLQLQYQWTPDVMSYVSATSGYLSGGFNAQLPYFPPAGVPASSYYNLPFQQETMWNYEVGLKGEWFNHRLRVDIDGFDQIFDNFQTSIITYYNGIDVGTTSSGADVHERGYELEIDAIPIDNLTLMATFSRLGQGYDAIFPAAQASLSKNAAPTTAPLEQASLLANYTAHLPNGGTVVPALNWRYEGTQFSGTYPLQYLEPGYALLGANLAYHAPGNKWSIAFWGNNVTNKYYFESYTNRNVPNTNIGIQQITPGRPREVGATFRWNF